MTVPKGFRDTANRVSGMVVEMFNRRQAAVDVMETQLGPHLRGNVLLYEALTKLVLSRIEGRARLALPSTPLESHASMARDKECRWLLTRLEEIYHAPVQTQDDGEQPD